MSEVNVVVALKCRRAPFSDAVPHEEFINVLSTLLEVTSPTEILGASDWIAVAGTCRAANNLLCFSSFWLRYEGYSLKTWPAAFCPFLLYASLCEERRKAVKLRRTLMTGRVADERTTSLPTALSVSLSDTDSLAFWQGRVSTALKLPRMPTAPQERDLRDAVDILLSKGQTCDDVLALVSGDSCNKVVGAILVEHLYTRAAPLDAVRRTLKVGPNVLVEPPAGAAGSKKKGGARGKRGKDGVEVGSDQVAYFEARLQENNGKLQGKLRVGWTLVDGDDGGTGKDGCAWLLSLSCTPNKANSVSVALRGEDPEFEQPRLVDLSKYESRTIGCRVDLWSGRVAFSVFGQQMGSCFSLPPAAFGRKIYPFVKTTEMEVQPVFVPPFLHSPKLSSRGPRKTKKKKKPTNARTERNIMDWIVTMTDTPFPSNKSAKKSFAAGAFKVDGEPVARDFTLTDGCVVTAERSEGTYTLHYPRTKAWPTTSGEAPEDQAAASPSTPSKRANPSTKAVARCLVDVDTILHVFALLHGRGVDDLKAEKWKLRSARIPNGFRAATMQALSAMSWVQLFDLLKKPGIVKRFFTDIHYIARVRQVKDEAVRGKLYLMQALVRREKYPATAEEYIKKDWDVVIVRSLQEMAKDPLVDVDEAWMVGGFSETLCGKAINCPALKTVERTLALEQDKLSVWLKMFDDNRVTPAQVLSNVRNLVRVACPVDVVRPHIMRGVKSGQLSVGAVLKAQQIIERTYTEEFAHEVTAKLASTIAKETDAPEIRVLLPAQIFRDKKGQATEKACNRLVHPDFAAAIAPFHALMEEALEAALGLVLPAQPAQTAVLSLSCEMDNPVRVGLPPAIPEYSRTSLWRNETVSLQQVAKKDEKIDVIRAGVTWCQQPKGQNVDLDLSVLLYDQSWAFIDHCSYQKIALGECIKHSGDRTSAPYPAGAREAVDINLGKLRGEFPSCRYVCVGVYAYSKQKFEDLHDASGFIANPNSTGTGPGGMEVLSAARLTGEGTANIAGYITLHPDGRESFTNVDQTMQVKSVSATASSGMVGSQLQRITKSVASPSILGLSTVAMLWAAALAEKRVKVVAEEGVTVFERNGSESTFAFFRRIQTGCRDLKRATKPTYKECDSEERTVFLGGSLDVPDAVAGAHAAAASAGNLVIMNMRSDEEEDVERELDVGVNKSAPVTVVGGWNALERVAAAFNNDRSLPSNNAKKKHSSPSRKKKEKKQAQRASHSPSRKRKRAQSVSSSPPPREKSKKRARRESASASALPKKKSGSSSVSGSSSPPSKRKKKRRVVSPPSKKKKRAQRVSSSVSPPTGAKRKKKKRPRSVSSSSPPRKKKRGVSGSPSRGKQRSDTTKSTKKKSKEKGKAKKKDRRGQGES